MRQARYTAQQALFQHRLAERLVQESRATLSKAFASASSWESPEDWCCVYATDI
jgi:hypothetical protein